jgi:hypothetical protein
MVTQGTKIKSSWLGQFRRDGCAVGTALALAEDAALLSVVEALAVFFEALGLAALTPPPHLRELEAEVKDCGDLLDIFGEGAGVASEGL